MATIQKHFFLYIQLGYSGLSDIVARKGWSKVATISEVHCIVAHTNTLTYSYMYVCIFLCVCIVYTFDLVVAKLYMCRSKVLGML